MDARPDIKPYGGQLNAHQAAAAMQAARLNSLDLVDTAEILFNLKRFAHSVPFSILAIEESGKIIILQAILLGFDDLPKLWRAYRRHQAKTAHLNIGIRARVRATFPDVSLEEAQEIAAQGPTPGDLETAKQRAIHSDCVTESGEFVCHLPRNHDWRHEAWDRLCEAQAIVSGPRDRSPEELEIWVKHVSAANAQGRAIVDILPELHGELQARGFVHEGWWDGLLKDAEALS